MNLDYFFSGLDTQAYRYMGAHKLGDGVEFYVWAPHARKVEVFMSKDDFKVFYEFEKVDNRGIWHLIIEHCECIYSYRYRITGADGKIVYKSDPYAFYSERRPDNASVMYDLSQYRFTDDEYMAKRNFSYGNGLEATSAAFLTKGDVRLAVLVSSIEESGEGDADKTYSRAERIMLYDENLHVAGEIPLEGELCTAIGAEGDQLYLFVDQNMEVYEKGEENWTMVASRKLKHPVTQFHGADVDGNGTTEYLMTDGRDLYMYHQLGGSMRKIWSTHLGVENFYGPIASGDLNGDGVKEIYCCDTTATTIRYVLTAKGLQAENEDIEYGQCIYPCDFDGNGKWDYWFVKDNIDRMGQLYLAVEEEQR